MPLRALLDGKDIIAPSLTRDEWALVRESVREGRRELLLPCCRARALQRTSFLGLQHFYHPPNARCSERGETIEHLYAKAAIVRGCTEAGYEAQTEWEEDGWRADVMARKGKIRIAFEVQWSQQTLRQTRERHERYAASNVRACWLFRSIPRRVERTKDEREIEPQRELPIFLLGPPHGNDLSVRLNGRHLPLDRFVAALLTGKIRFRDRLTIPRVQDVVLNFFPVSCEHCGKESHVFSLDERVYRSCCGLDVPLHHGWHDAVRPALRKEVQRAAWAFLLTDDGLPLRVGAIKEREGRTWSGKRRCFGCFHCDAPFDGYTLSKLEEEVRRTDRWTATIEVPVAMARGFSLDRPHWCHPDDGQFCARPLAKPIQMEPRP